MERQKSRELSSSELQAEIAKTSEQLFRLRFQSKMGQQGGAKNIPLLRRRIARLKTVKREQELGINSSKPGAVIDPGIKA